jgi:cyclase
MPVTVGGGVRTVADIRKLLLCRRRQGVDQHGGGEGPGFRRRGAADKFGNQCIVVAHRRQEGFGPGEADRWEIFTHGGATRRHRRGRVRPAWSIAARARSC